MTIDISQFFRFNVADTCSVWNLLSSNLLFATATAAGCTFSCTAFVEYECLRKPRKKVDPADLQLQGAMRTEQAKGRLKVFHLAIEDLLEIEVLENRRRLGKGELSAIAFAKRTNQAFLTDDQNARKLAANVMSSNLVQTTPHLFGWLLFSRLLGDSDKDRVIAQHQSSNRPLKPYLEQVYEYACEVALTGRIT